MKMSELTDATLGLDPKDLNQINMPDTNQSPPQTQVQKDQNTSCLQTQNLLKQ